MPIVDDASVTLYYAPRSRSFTALWLLEELGCPYRLESFTLASGRHKQADYLALNPLGKVPVVMHNNTPISELGAIAVYLGDVFGDTRLVPTAGEPARAAYLRWIFFGTAILEPAFAQKFFRWEADPSRVAWGSFDQAEAVATSGVRPGPWLLGERFTLADVVAGSCLRFGVLFGAFAKEGPIADYVQRLTAREAFLRAAALEDELSTKLLNP
jgi:glutathione S-transferase